MEKNNGKKGVWDFADNLVSTVTKYKKEKAEIRERENKVDSKVLIIVLGMMFVGSALAAIIGGSCSAIKEKKRQQEIQAKLNAGYIQMICSDEDLIGENYLAVKHRLEAAGFTNFELIDLGGWLLDGDVKSISIAGKSDFSTYDCFLTDAKIVITHY